MDPMRPADDSERMETTARTADFIDSTELLADPDALRAQAAELGYLFFRGLLPTNEVLSLRRDMLEVIARHGWLDPRADLMDGIVDDEAFSVAVATGAIDFCGVGVTPAAYRDIQHLESFHALAHHPALLAVYGTLFGRPVLPHARNIARIQIPNEQSVPTPPHQDHIHIQGTTNVWTAWFPLGDCPIELGGLSVLAGSHKEGTLSYKESGGAGGLEAYLCDLEYPWAQGDFAAGDVLTFVSQTVHQALPNQIPDRIRLSCDYRYQPADEDIHESSMLVHCGVDDWDSIYADWSDRTLVRYWENHELRLSEWDEALRWQKEKIC